MTQKLKLTFEVTFCKSTLCCKLHEKKKIIVSNLSGWKREWIGPLVRILRIQSVRDIPRADWVFFLDVVIVTNVKFLYFYCIESWSIIEASPHVFVRYISDKKFLLPGSKRSVHARQENFTPYSKCNWYLCKPLPIWCFTSSVCLSLSVCLCVCVFVWFGIFR